MPHYTSKEATELMQALVAASWICLDHLKIPRIPKGKRKPWKHSGGPIGCCHHYTNGVNGIKSIKWFNHPGWGNKGSSCHAMIFDRLIPELEDIWPKQEIASVFKVPTLIHADVASGTWNCNWANALLFGIENRNTGYSGYRRLKNGLDDLGKSGMKVQDRTYEESWREQIAANILLDRIWLGIRGDNFRPEWICGHSQIWETKGDPGPLFPSMHELRSAVWGGPSDVNEVEWLERFEPAPTGQAEADDDQDVTGDDRGNPEKTEKSWHVEEVETPVPDEKDLPYVSMALYMLGWPTGPEILSPQDLKPFIVHYQRSTLAWKYLKNPKPERVLVIDGVAGPKTKKSLTHALKRLRLS